MQNRREQDSNLKTQIRFGHSDLEILTKMKGQDEPFIKVPLKEFIEDEQIPGFDFKMKWSNKVDRAPRRKVTSSRESSPNTSPAGPSSQKNNKEIPLNKVSRKSSWNEADELPTKKKEKWFYNGFLP